MTSTSQTCALNDVPFFPIPPHDKEVPVEERNGDAHDEAEQAADEEEGGGEGVEGEEVVEDEGAPAEAEEEQEEEDDQVVEETDEVTDDTVNAALPESTSPPSVPGMLCLLRPSSSPSFPECSVFPLSFASLLCVLPSLFIRLPPRRHFSSSHRHLAPTLSILSRVLCPP